MATPVNCGVNEAENKVIYDLSSIDLTGLPKRTVSFTIEDINDEQSQAIFRVTDQNGSIIRENVSRPFPIGAIQVRRQLFIGGDYVVTLTNNAGINLQTTFGQ